MTRTLTAVMEMHDKRIVLGRFTLGDDGLVRSDFHNFNFEREIKQNGVWAKGIGVVRPRDGAIFMDSLVMEYARSSVVHIEESGPPPKRSDSGDWDESKHPRAGDGKFGEGSGQAQARASAPPAGHAAPAPAPTTKGKGKSRGKKGPKKERVPASTLSPHEQSFVQKLHEIPKGASKEEVLKHLGMSLEDAAKMAHAIKERHTHSEHSGEHSEHSGEHSEHAHAHGGHEHEHAGHGEHKKHGEHLFAQTEHPAFLHHKAHLLDLIHLLTGTGG